ncbi:MAG TPA: hypothetical protein VJ714_06120, partial [Anaerolineae bacterium]|nr:hypothetical protein [Anaerolineae bacterium]
ALNTYQVFYNEATDQYATVFPYGTAFLYLPSYWLASLANKLPVFHVNDPYFIQHQGVPLAYSFLFLVWTTLCALLAVSLTFLSTAKFTGPGAALFSAVALFLATPLLYYSTIEPYMSHVPGTLLIALAIYILVTRRQHSLSWFFMGFVLGVAFLVRWQLALYALPIGLWALVKGEWRKLLLLLIGFMLLAWHLPFTWWRMYGSPWVVPAAVQGQQEFLAWPAYFTEVLFSSQRGLILWSPLVVLALAGLVLLLRKDRGLSICLILMFVLQVLMNASVHDWGGGWAFGMRRMTELYPVWVIGLAFLVHAARSLPTTVPWAGVARWAIPAVVVLGSVLGLVVLLAHLNYVNTNLAHPEGGPLGEELRYQFTDSDLRITAQVIKEHYGFWAWPKPGP